MQQCTILYYTILYYTILCHGILYYTILYYTILYYTILYYTILYFTVEYHNILYDIILYHTIQYHYYYYHYGYQYLYYRIVSEGGSHKICNRSAPGPSSSAGSSRASPVLLYVMFSQVELLLDLLYSIVYPVFYILPQISVLSSLESSLSWIESELLLFECAIESGLLFALLLLITMGVDYTIIDYTMIAYYYNIYNSTL